MPERPKRRKNNKNKKKNNKSVRTEVTDNNSSSSVSASVLSSVDPPSEKVNDIKEAEQGTDVCENIENVTPVDKICCPIESDISKENTCDLNLVSNETNMHLENKDSHEECLERYVVETPDQNKKQIPKLSNNLKSKSVDNDDSPTIVELIEEDNSQVSNSTLPLIESNNIIVSDAECDVLWQKVDDLVEFIVDPQDSHIKGALSITTLPLNIAQCNQTKSLSPEEESSLRCYLKTLNLSTNPEYASTSEIDQIINREIKHRLRKRCVADDNFTQRGGPSRSLALDVIDEEGSSESSMTSRRQSSLIDKKSDNEELEDEVFEPKAIQFSKSKGNNVSKRNSGHVIPQECIRVDAKIKEPEITEARGSWTTKIVEKITGAELVYLTDSSSSTSSVYDLNEDNENNEDSDQSVRIITPTIEVTDTEKLLTDLSKNKIVENDLKIIPSSEQSLEVNNEKNNLEQINHEILVESTENIKTDLIVKDVIQNVETPVEAKGEIALQRSPKAVDKYDLEIKVLKCELNDAINNLIKEVSSDSESVKDSSNDLLSRQDSSSSVGSSQCTAKYNPTHSSLNDVSNVIQDSFDSKSEISSHVKDVLDHVPQSQTMNSPHQNIVQLCSLRDLCIQKISLLPYGDKILEELAQVSTRLQYLSSLSFVQPIIVKSNISKKTHEKFDDYQSREDKITFDSHSLYTPPPLLPRKSSLKKSQDEKRPKIPPKPLNINKCVSPSQKMLMEKTNTIVSEKPAECTKNRYEKNHDDIKLNTANLSSKQDSNKSPFKSQTGSRLLSLICDSSINNNISSSLLKSFSSKHLDHIPKTESTKTFSDFESKLESIPSKTLFELPKHKKFSSSFYESDEGSECKESFFRNIQSERKYFHYSTGNLNSEIEDDISTIQNMHRYYTDIKNEKTKEMRPRRPSLPKDLCDQQMEYIRQKEKEVDAEIRRLEEQKLNCVSKRGPRAPMILESDNIIKDNINSQLYKTSKPSSKLTSLFSSSEEELHREKMYTEYVNQMAEREFRKEHKIIKITKPLTTTNGKNISQSMPVLDPLESKVNNRIEQEFITKARERWDKLGIKESEVEGDQKNRDLYSEPKVIEHKIKVIDSGEEKDIKNLPNHLQDFVKFTATGKEQETEGTGECEPGNLPTHVVVLCAVIIFMLTVRRYFLRLIRNT